MKILIVNDDGYRGPGLHALVNALKKDHELTVAVPSTEKSGTSNSITFMSPLSMEKIYLPETECDIWMVTGTPADCTAIALDQICEEKPDLLVSGINNGLNVADAVMYSGTVAAALQGVIAGIPTFALSSDFRCKDFSVAANLFKEMLPQFLEREGEEPFFFNINFPVLPLDQIKGIRNTELSQGKMIDSFEKRLSPYGREYFWHAYDGDSNVIQCLNRNSDVVALQEGYISITPIKLEYFDKDKFNKMSDYSEIFCEIKNALS